MREGVKLSAYARDFAADPLLVVHVVAIAYGTS
jgi:hypothetical protein